MKRVFRMVIFSGIAIYLTSLWNKGFIIPEDWQKLAITVLAVAMICYLVVPLSKIVLFPLNLFTMGLVSTVLYIGLLYLLDVNFSLVVFKSWIFPGLSIGDFALKKMQISYLTNLALSSVSISIIINALERLL